MDNEFGFDVEDNLDVEEDEEDLADLELDDE